MFKFIILICICSCICGCVYDPQTGALNIFNNTDSAIYVYVTYTDSLPLKYGLKLFEHGGGTDAYSNNMPDTISPNYRINAYSWQLFFGFGAVEKPTLYRGRGGKLSLFFIKEITMRTRIWKEIYKGQLYEKKMVLTQEQLNNLCWKVV